MIIVISLLLLLRFISVISLLLFISLLLLLFISLLSLQLLFTASSSFLSYKECYRTFKLLFPNVQADPCYLSILSDAQPLHSEPSA